MFDFKPDAGQGKPALYRDLIAAADALTEGESDGVANMANLAALLWQFLPNCNWTGFYRTVGGELVLGPFCGRPACLRIAVGQGVCGAAAATGESQLVPDVHAFPGHIACDAQSRSELVVPVLRQGPTGSIEVIAVIDCDSPTLNRFDAEDRAALEELARIIAPRI
jgi:GAF domain-containing protein